MTFLFFVVGVTLSIFNEQEERSKIDSADNDVFFILLSFH